MKGHSVSTGHRPPHVLVVDDEPDVRELVADLLEPLGTRLSEAGSYEAARAQLRSGEVDLAILDVMGVRGYDLLEEFGRRVPCIMLTGKALGLPNVRRAFDGEALLYLPKERLLDLTECVEHALAGAPEEAGALPVAPGDAAVAIAPAAAVPPEGPSRGAASLWRWFADRVDPSSWIGAAWSRDDPALAAELEVVARLRETPLGDGLPEAELQILAELVMVERYPDGARICRKGEALDAGLFVVYAGSVRVGEPGEAGGGERLGPGEAFGEGPVVLGRPPTATVRAAGEACVYRVSSDRFQARSAELPETMSRVLSRMQAATPARLVADTVDLIAHLGEVEAHHREARKALALAERARKAGRLLVVLVSFLALYAFGLAAVRVSGDDEQIASRAIEILGLVAVGFYLRGTGVRRRDLGLTWGRWRRSLLESLAFTIALCASATLLKAVLRPHVAALRSAPLLTFTKHPGLYVMGAVVQEFMARGVLLTTLEQMLTGRRRTLLAIVVSSLFFGTMHLHYGLALGTATVLLGCVWGWLFVRHRTLLGVTVSHVLIGVWVLGVLVGSRLLESLP